MDKIDISRCDTPSYSGTPTHGQRCVGEVVFDRRGERFGDFEVIVSELNLWLDRVTLYYRGKRILDLMEQNTGTWWMMCYLDGTEEDMLGLYLNLVLS